MNFRFKALEQRRQPDQLDSPTILASPRGWVAVFVVLITTVFLAFWGALGSIPRSLDVRGLIAHPGGIVEVNAPVSGTVVSLPSEAGSTSVVEGATLARLQVPGGASVPLTSPVDGRVVSQAVSEGAVVVAGAPLLQVEVVESVGEPLSVFLFVDAAQVPSVRKGQSVTFAVPGVSPRVYGRLRGTVVEVGQYPLTDLELARITGGLRLKQGSFSLGVGPRLVTVRLVRDSGTASGYAWTSAGGPPGTLGSRTPVDAEVAIGTISPFAMLIGG